MLKKLNFIHEDIKKPNISEEETIINLEKDDNINCQYFLSDNYYSNSQTSSEEKEDLDNKKPKIMIVQMKIMEIIIIKIK